MTEAEALKRALELILQPFLQGILAGAGSKTESKKPDPKCALEKCTRSVSAKKLCRRHYVKAARLGFTPPYSPAHIKRLSADFRSPLFRPHLKLVHKAG